MKPFLSSHTLKLIACGTMLIDHIGLIFFPGAELWRIIGRVSFPLFAFLIAEGHERTSHSGRYAARLFALALISEWPFQLVNGITASAFRLNIFTTLFAGLISLMLVKRFSLYLSAPLVALIIGAAELLHFDYGAYGIFTILACALFLRFRAVGSIALSGLPFLYTGVKAAFGIFTLQAFAVFSLPFVWLYDGRLGYRAFRYLFYAFYPVHLFILWFIFRAMYLSP